MVSPAFRRVSRVPRKSRPPPFSGPSGRRSPGNLTRPASGPPELHHDVVWRGVDASAVPDDTLSGEVGAVGHDVANQEGSRFAARTTADTAVGLHLVHGREELAPDLGTLLDR